MYMLPLLNMNKNEIYGDIITSLHSMIVRKNNCILHTSRVCCDFSLLVLFSHRAPEVHSHQGVNY